MDKAERQQLFNQFYLYKVHDLNMTKTSSYCKTQAFVKGALVRQKLQLYKSKKYFLTDIQTIINYDPESALVILPDHNIKINKEKKKVLTQCYHCGKITQIWKFGQRCEDVHYCSQTCQVNAKITYEKQHCVIKMYPNIHHATLIQVHFGSNLGQNVQVYFQHQTRMSALIRGQQIINTMFQYFTKGEGSPKVLGYNVQVRDSHLQLSIKNEQDYRSGILKVQIENFDELRRIYEDNEVLQAVQLYLLKQGGIMTNYVHQVHNNHIHLVYIFNMP